MIRNYFLTALRNLWRNKIFSLINIAGLSVGLACCMLIFLYAKDELSYDQFHKNKENIYRITADMGNPDGGVSKTGNTGMMPGPRFAASIPEIESYVRVQDQSFTIRHNAQIFDQKALAVDDNFFSVFTFPLMYGSAKTALTDIHSVVLSESVAKKYFGTPNAVGKVLELKTSDSLFEPFTVSAIAKESPQNSSIKLQLLIPMKFIQSQYDDHAWANFFLNSFVVLKPGTNIQSVVNKCNIIYHSEAAQELKEALAQYGYKDHTIYKLQPFTDMHLSKDYQADNGLSDASNPTYSYILTGIALFILLIACINFINLTVARSLKRAKEIGIRKVIGGQRKQLIAQFLGESFILSFIAFLFAVVLVQLLLPFFNTLSNKSLSFSYLLDAKLIGGYIAIFLVTGLLAGFYPALVLSGFSPVETLYGKLRFSSKNYLSKSLVVFQFSLATFLIIATIIIYSQFNYLTHFDLGYNDKNVAVVRVGHIDRSQVDLFRNEASKYASIQSVSADQGGDWGTHAHINGDVDAFFNFKIVDQNYFPLLQIPVIKGRNFSADLPTDTAQAVVVNEAFVKMAGWKQPLGQIVDFFYQNKKYNVIGVVKDYHFASLNETVKPQIFITNPSYKYGNIYVKIKPGQSADALSYLSKLFKQLFPFQPYQYSFKQDDNAAQYDAEAKWKQIILFAASLTIFISCIGLFGLATLSAEKRTKEIGIRKVLGASATIIVTRLTSDFLKLVLLSIVIAVPAAWWAMSQWLNNYPYRTTINGWMLGSASMVVLLVALATISSQSIKAALANPVKSLRTE